MSGGKIESAAGAESAVYKQIEADMRLRIGRGQWSVREMLPGRRDLARHYQVSPLTVERAVTGLIADGLLRVDGRRGTFIARSAPSSATNKLGGAPAGPASAATIGIVGRLFSGSDSHLDVNNQCVRAAVHSIESACALDKNVTRFINQVSPGATPMAQPEAIARAAEAGVDALILVAIGIDLTEMSAAFDMYGQLGEPFPLVIMSTNGRIGRPLAQVHGSRRADRET